MDVEGQQVVLHEAPVFRLILRDDTEVRFLQSGGQVDGFAPLHVPSAFLADDSRGNLQPRCAVDAALTAMVVLAVGVQGDDLVAEKARRLRTGVCEQRFLLREVQLEGLLQKLLQALLDLPGPFPRSTEAQQESSSPGELPPRALSDPDVKLALHPAPMIQSPVESRSARGRADAAAVVLPAPASGLRWCSDVSTVCASGMPI